MTRRLAGCLLVAAACAMPAGAQVVRGRVTEVNSSTPVVGALVSLLGETRDSAVVSVLTTRSGEYAIRAPGVGSYRLAVKRIGVQRFVSAPFALASGETRNIDVPIAALAMTLPEVAVSGLCSSRRAEGRRIASLWDEARTALQATEISLRDRLIDAQISRYAAELDPRSLRVLFDWRTDVQVMTTQPFTSLSGDSLSLLGYWRSLESDSVEYMAPDASALASNAFVRDHCFSLAPAKRGRPDLVGLAFVPASSRTMPDIMGTIWLDARGFELRFIEFRYTRLPPMPDAERVGGEVHFTRLASGAWIVDRWFIRFPQVIVSPLTLEPRRQLYEGGGTVITDGGQSSIAPASVTGIVRDSIGVPMEGAVVRAIGTHRQALTNSDGAFLLDSVPPGSFAIVVHTDGYDSFAVLAGHRRLDLQSGAEYGIQLFAPRSADIRSQACPDAAMNAMQLGRGRGALRLIMVDSATSVPMPGVRFVASWPPIADTRPNQRDEDRQQVAITDSRGAATFCNLPHSYPVEISLADAAGRRSYVMMVELNTTGIVGRVITGRFNR